MFDELKRFLSSFLKLENIPNGEVFNYMLRLKREFKEIDGIGDVFSQAYIILESGYGAQN